jgi:hypothetical protein
MSITITKKVAALGVAGVAVLGGGAAAFAATTGGSDGASSTPPSTAAPASATAHPGGAGRLGAIARRTDHGVFEVKSKDGTWVTVTVDRGTVEAASATSITLDRPDGQKATIAVDTATKFHGPRMNQAVP